MHRTQIYFGLVCGTVLMALGVALAMTGLADWGLSTVGAILLTLSVYGWRDSSSRPALQALCLPSRD